MRKDKAAPKPATRATAKPPKGKPAKQGRSSLYKPEYCKRIVELGKQGKTKSQMAAALDIALSTFNAWLDAHEEFAEAHARADTQARAFMEGLAERGVFLGARFNDRAWIVMLRSRWPDFKDERSLELSGAVGGDPVKLVVSQLESGL
jgi:transposase